MAVPPVFVRVGTPTPDTMAPPAPRVKLPDMRRPITPAPNSWAEAEKLENLTAKPVHELQPTNRDRYENNPSTELSKSTSHHVNLQQRRHVQPAIPLIKTSSAPKHRAVTDPIQHRALLSTKKPSVSQLKKKGKIFEFSSSRVDLSNESRLPSSNVPPKALQLLGVRQEETFGQQTSNVRIQTPVQDHRLQDGLAGEDQVSAGISLGMDQAGLSTTGPSTSVNEQSSLQQLPVVDIPVSNVAKTYPIPQESNKTNLQLPNAASSHEGKQFGVVRQQILHPSKSFQAIIETASPISTEEHGGFKVEPQRTPTKGLQHEPSGEVLRPTVYSPNSYNGVWEFDPAVVSKHIFNLHSKRIHIFPGSHFTSL